MITARRSAPASSEKPAAALALAGSAARVVDFFRLAISAILYQRGLYPPEHFTSTKKYGLTLLSISDESVKSYIDQILRHLDQWLSDGVVRKLVIVISSKDTGETLERWQFDVALDQPNPNIQPSSLSAISNPSNDPIARTKMAAQIQKPTKTDKEIHTEIAAIMRQITACVSFLPVLNDPCTFNVLVYTDKEAKVPAVWVDSDARLISHNAEQVRLRSFNTTVHQVEGLVAYRLDMDAV